MTTSWKHTLERAQHKLRYELSERVAQLDGPVIRSLSAAIGSSSGFAERDMVLVSGFGWSGSSAVVDLFLEHTRTRTPLGTEIDFLKVLKHLVDTPWRHHPGWEAFLLGEVTDALFAEEPRAEYYANKLRFFFADNLTLTHARFRDRAMPVLEQLRAAGLGHLDEDEMLDHDVVARAGTDYLLLIHDTVQRRRSLTIYDNLLHAYRLDFLTRLDLARLPPITVVVVDRDPRDEFFDRIEQGKRDVDEVEQFVAGFLARRRAYAEAFGPDSAAEAIEVQFEDLVAPHSAASDGLRRRLDRVIERNQLGGRCRWAIGRHFRPEESRHNVGKWQQASDQGPYEAIAGALADWCVQFPQPRSEPDG